MQEWLVRGRGLEPQGDCTASGSVDAGVAIGTNMIIGAVQTDGVAELAGIIDWAVSKDPVLEKAEESEASPLVSSSFHQALKSTSDWLLQAQLPKCHSQNKYCKVGCGTGVQIDSLANFRHWRSLAPGNRLFSQVGIR